MSHLGSKKVFPLKAKRRLQRLDKGNRREKSIMQRSIVSCTLKAASEESLLDYKQNHTGMA